MNLGSSALQRIPTCSDEATDFARVRHVILLTLLNFVFSPDGEVPKVILAESANGVTQATRRRRSNVLLGVSLDTASGNRSAVILTAR